MRAWSSARFGVPLPPGHRFPIGKYALVRDQVVRAGLLPPEAIEEPDRTSVADLALAHTAEWIEAIERGTLSAEACRRLGFPWSPELRERALRTVQGTVEASRDALRSGAGLNLAGGTHHAFADRGEGFCVFNDAAVAILAARRDGLLGRAAIVDLDVHQGNGTASIFAGDESVFTFSMHGEKNYPLRRERSDLDVELPDGTGDEAYLERLAGSLDMVLDRSRPDLVAYLAGADPFAGDRFGRLGLTFEGLRLRDRMVFEACRRRGLPVVVTLAGGYGRELADIARIHLATVQELLDVFGYGPAGAASARQEGPSWSR
jgi:acetoin utilization deacetylase AcuC-like enzyme